MWIFDSGLVYLFRPFFEVCSLYSFWGHTLIHMHIHIWRILLRLSTEGWSAGGCLSLHSLARVEMVDGGWGFGCGWGTACSARNWAAVCCLVLGGSAELGGFSGLPELPGSGSIFAARTGLFWQRCAPHWGGGHSVNFWVELPDIG